MRSRHKQLVGIIFISTVLRILLIHSRSIQYDDAFTLLLASRSLPEIITGTAADTMPPLFYILMHFWLFLGRKLWIARGLTVLISVGSVLLAYQMIWELTGDQGAGLATAALVGASPLQIYHAQDIRMYALLAFSELAYLLFFGRIWRSREKGTINWRDWLGLIVSGIVAMYTHNLAIFWLTIPLILLIATKSWRTLFRMILALGLIGLAALPWLIKIPGQVAKIQNAFWTPRPGVIEIFQSILLFNATLPLPQPWLLICAILSVQILVLVGVEAAGNKVKRAEILFLTAFAAIPPFVLLIASYVIRPIFVTRGFLASSFAYYGLAGYLISLGWKRHVGKLLAIGFAAAFILSLPYQISYAEFPRSPFLEAVRDLEGLMDSETLVLHDNKLSFFPFYYFAPNLQQSFLPDEPGSSNDTLARGTQEALGIFPETDLAEATNGFKKIHFVTFELAMQNYRETGVEHPTILWLRDNYELVNQRNYHDLVVLTFCECESGHE